MARTGNDRKTQVNFNGGELSPLLRGRTDLDIWQRGCRQMQNMTPRKYGNAERRVGTQYICEVKDSSKAARLLAFQNTETDGTVIEMGPEYFRFVKDGAQITSSDTPYEITHPYVENDLFDVQYKSINDIILMTHWNYPVQKVSHYADTNWTDAEIEFDEPAFQDQNTDDDLTITPSATTGSVTLTASAALFDSSMVGGYYKLGQKRLTSTVKLSETAAGTYTSSSISLKGKFTFRTSGTWEGTVYLKRLDSGTWNTVYTFESSKDQNFNQELEQSDDEYHTWEIVFTLVDRDGAPAKVYLESLEAYVYGWAKITAFTSSTVVTATVKHSFQNTTATNVWMEGSWSPYRGYPAAIAFFQDRCVYGGTYHQPQTIWATASGDYYNFEGITGTTDIKDDDAVSATMGSTERVFQKWMEVLGTSIIAGTFAEEFSISGGNGGDDPITATSLLIRMQTSTGSSGVRPVHIGNAILHVQRDGKKVYEVTYSIQSYGYEDADITQFAEHLTHGAKIVDMWYCRQPDPTLYAVLDNGTLLTCVYDQAQKVLAWSRIVTEGSFESGCCIHTLNGDENYVLVKRMINGATKRYIERFYPVQWTTQDECWYVDCGLNGTATNTENISSSIPSYTLATKSNAICLSSYFLYSFSKSGGIHKTNIKTGADTQISTICDSTSGQSSMCIYGNAIYFCYSYGGLQKIDLSSLDVTSVSSYYGFGLCTGYLNRVYGCENGIVFYYDPQTSETAILCNINETTALWGICSDSLGNLYVCGQSNSNNTDNIWKVNESDGSYSLLVSYDISADISKHFYSLCFANDGNIYASSRFSNVIKRITTSGDVSVFKTLDSTDYPFCLSSAPGRNICVSFSSWGADISDTIYSI